MWRYVIPKASGALWSDLQVKDFLFGSYLHMIVGPYRISSSGVVTGLIREEDRTSDTGWIPIDYNLPTIRLSKPVTNYKKLLFVFADESVNENLDDDVQIYFQEIDVAKYCWLNEIHIEREDLYENVKNLKGTLDVAINGTTVTYDSSVYKGACHNYKRFLYPHQNVYFVNNGNGETHKPCLVYNRDYKNSLLFYSPTSVEYLVACIGLK